MFISRNDMENSEEMLDAKKLSPFTVLFRGAPCCMTEVDWYDV